MRSPTPSQRAVTLTATAASPTNSLDPGRPPSRPARRPTAGSRSSPGAGNFHDREWGFLVIVDTAAKPTGMQRFRQPPLGVLRGERLENRRPRSRGWGVALAPAGVIEASEEEAQTVAFTRQQIRDSVERAGDEHWEALVRHHTDVYPESNPTPGDICRAEAERLNDLGLGDNPDVELVESRVERVPPAVRITHVFEDRDNGTRVRDPAVHWLRVSAARDS